MPPSPAHVSLTFGLMDGSDVRACDRSDTMVVPACRPSARRLAVALVALVALCAATATVIVSAALPPAVPYTIRTSTGAELVDIANPQFNFSRHGWRGEHAARKNTRRSCTALMATRIDGAGSSADGEPLL